VQQSRHESPQILDDINFPLGVSWPEWKLSISWERQSLLGAL